VGTDEGEVSNIDTVEPILSSLEVSVYPNPFNPQTTFLLNIREDSFVKADIYNVKGQLIRSLLGDFVKRGEYKYVWFGEDNHGRYVGSGVYFYRVRTESVVKQGKVVLLK
jgi:flagellar hook assembly protein FlgD